MADEDGTILGAASMTDAGKVLLNYVSPDARFRGVSKALMQALEEHASALPGLRSAAWTARKPHCRFYQSLGYERTDQSYIHPVTGSPALALAKQLRPAGAPR